YGKVGNMARIVKSLKIVTNNGETYEYGRPGTEGSFHVPVNDGQIVSFFGRAGDYLDAIGIYVHP
ncbi:jacalin-like lectin, partial [Klebsiella pneumoniae]|uniref:jacalin-like lectin n=1 Tax=Klebsiella pneumoniae TaxID=573 RepID=UPI003531B712